MNHDENKLILDNLICFDKILILGVPLAPRGSHAIKHQTMRFGSQYADGLLGSLFFSPWSFFEGGPFLSSGALLPSLSIKGYSSHMVTMRY